MNPTLAKKVDFHDVEIPIREANLHGNLTSVNDAKGLVIFAHGSGSSRFSVRNRGVAKTLNRANFSTLLFDLLTAAEDAEDQYTRAYRFDIPLLAERLELVTDWAATQADIGRLPIGYFGASTGAAAALIAAADKPAAVGAVVSRGGRADMADEALVKVKAPTLLIVGGCDDTVLELNRQALSALKCPKKLEIVPGATHLFEEMGALDKVAYLAADWFTRHLAAH